MIESLFFSVLVIFLGFLASKGLRYGLEICFISIFIFLSIRFDFGNDYQSYLASFLSIESFKNLDPFYFKENEIGWFYFNYLFSLFGPIGFHFMLVFIALFNSYVGYKFFKMYVPMKYYGLAIFLYLTEPSNVFILSSGLRQSIAVSIFLLSLSHLVKYNPFKFLFFIFLGSLFHTSILFLIPLVFIKFFKFNSSMFLFFLFLLGIQFSFNEKVYSVVNVLLIDSISFYSYYTKEGYESTNLGLGFFLNFSILVITYLTFSTHVRKLPSFSYLVFFHIIPYVLVIYILVFSVGAASRIMYYFSPVLIVCFLYVFDSLIKYSSFKLTYISLIVVFFIFNFYSFWTSPVYSPYFQKYNTVFSSNIF